MNHESCLLCGGLKKVVDLKDATNQVDCPEYVKEFVEQEILKSKE